MASVSREVDQQYKSLLIKLCDMMNPDDPTYKNFILYLQSYIPKGRLLSVQRNPTAVFYLMEEKGILRVGEYRALEEALNASGYIDILNALKDGQKSIAARQMRKRSYRDGPMADGSSNIVTATMSSMEPEESQKNISSPKVLNRNVTFNITDARGSNIVTGDNSHSVINVGSQKEVLDAGLPFTIAASNILEDEPVTVSSIKPEDIKNLRDGLIQVYRKFRCTGIQVSPKFEKMKHDIDNIYVDLVIEKNKDTRNIEEKQGSRNTEEESKLIVYPREKVNVTSYKQIFLDDQGTKLKRVFVLGTGGLGKTTFCRKVLHAWCNAHEGRAVTQDSYFWDEDFLLMFDLLFYMNLRDVSVEKSLIKAIRAQIPLAEVPSENKLGTLLKHTGDKALFILDGLDEMRVTARFIENVVTRREYANCCFLVSSRPWKISKLELHEGIEIDLLLYVQGFNNRTAKQFAKNIFENCYKDTKAIKQFMKDVSYNNLAKQLVHVPLLLLFLVHVWYDNERSLPSKLHELYILFLNQMVDRLKEKYKKDPKHKPKSFPLSGIRTPLPSKILETSLVKNFGEGFLLSICEVAHHFLLCSDKENSLVFEDTKLLKTLGVRGEEKLDVALDLGILSITDSMSYLDINTSVSFLHETMQEFFTALCFILNPEKLANFISSLADLNDVQQNENIIVFLFGLMPEFGNRVLGKMNELCSDDWETLRKEWEWHFLDKDSILYAVSKIYLRCKEEVIGENVLLNASGLSVLITQTKCDLPSITEFDHLAWNPGFLHNLDLSGVLNMEHEEYVSVDLRELTGLVYLSLQFLTCKLYLPESGSLSVLIMFNIRLHKSCCDVLGRTLAHCTKLETLKIDSIDLYDSLLLNLSNMTELTILVMKLDTHNTDNTNLHHLYLPESGSLSVLIMDSIRLHNSCFDVLGRTLTCYPNLEILTMHNTDLYDCMLDLSDMTELTVLDMSGVTLSSSCCDVLGRTLTYCTKLKRLKIHSTDLYDCVLDLSDMTELTVLDMSGVTLSSRCCDVLGMTLTHCSKLKKFKIRYTYLHNCLLDFSDLTELVTIRLDEITLSNRATVALALSFQKLQAAMKRFKWYTFNVSQIDYDRCKVSMLPPSLYDECCRNCCTLL